MVSLTPGVQLDLSAMGEGYAIDMIADFLESKNVSDYNVEIGGEMKCKGKNEKRDRWLIGVENPSSAGNRILTTVSLDDEAISTSGTARKFYLDETGVKRSHIIDPKTGYSIHNNLLSVTIKNSKAARADALATALLVMGLDSAKSFAARTNTAALIVYEKNGKVLSWHSPDFFNTQGERCCAIAPCDPLLVAAGRAIGRLRTTGSTMVFRFLTGRAANGSVVLRGATGSCSYLLFFFSRYFAFCKDGNFCSCFHCIKVFHR
jgi:hypothetical protein